MKNRVRHITRQIQVSQGGTEEKEGIVMGQTHYFYNYPAESTKPSCYRGISLVRFGATCSQSILSNLEYLSYCNTIFEYSSKNPTNSPALLCCPFSYLSYYCCYSFLLSPVLITPSQNAVTIKITENYTGKIKLDSFYPFNKTQFT